MASTLAGSDNNITIHTTGSGDFVNVTGTGDSVLDYYIGGNTITITLGDSDSAAIYGPDTAIASGDNASIYSFGTGTTVALSGNTDLAYVSGTDTGTDVTGDNGHVELVGSGAAPTP